METRLSVGCEIECEYSQREGLPSAADASEVIMACALRFVEHTNHRTAHI